MEAKDYWTALDELVKRHRIVVDRPKGSSHPRFPDSTSPLDYGYLDGTVSGDGCGVDVWLGSLPDRMVQAVICTVDLIKGDVETKLIMGCKEEEIKTAVSTHRSYSQSAILVRKPIVEGQPLNRV